MPGKSKHSKGKRPQNRARARQPISPSAANTTGAPSGVPAAAGVSTASAPARAPKSAAGKAMAKTMVYSGATAEQYPFFTSELKRIGVITGIILVVLIVLSLILR
jgi:hypothetical protein